MVRVQLDHPRGNTAKLISGLLDRDAGLQPADHADVVRPTASRRDIRGRKRERHPQVSLEITIQHRMDHGGHTVALPVDLDFLSNDGPISAIAPFPQAFRKNHDVVLSVLFIVGSEQTAQNWLDSEHRKGAGGDALAIDVRLHANERLWAARDRRCAEPKRQPQHYGPLEQLDAVQAKRTRGHQWSNVPCA